VENTRRASHVISMSSRAFVYPVSLTHSNCVLQTDSHMSDYKSLW